MRSRATAGLSCLLGLLVGVSTGPGCTSETPPTPLSCDELATWAGEGVVIAAPEAVAASEKAPAHCKVAGTIDTAVRFELLLPEHDAWNGRFAMGGGGGFVGSVVNVAMGSIPRGTALERGFATVGTDTGHKGSPIDARWALDDDESEINFGYRAVHRTTEIAVLAGLVGPGPVGARHDRLLRGRGSRRSRSAGLLAAVPRSRRAPLRGWSRTRSAGPAVRHRGLGRERGGSRKASGEQGRRRGRHAGDSPPVSVSRGRVWDGTGDTSDASSFRCQRPDAR